MAPLKQPNPNPNQVASLKQRLIDYDDKSRRTALHIAAFKSREGEMVALTSPTPTPSLSPLTLNPDPDQVALLLKHGADPNAVDAGGNTGSKLAEKTGR